MAVFPPLESRMYINFKIFNLRLGVELGSNLPRTLDIHEMHLVHPNFQSMRLPPITNYHLEPRMLASL
jgi:hypothetical protein